MKLATHFSNNIGDTLEREFCQNVKDFLQKISRILKI